jgi:ABC-type glycerol-3-phosphate transport system substrate-binding protein
LTFSKDLLREYGLENPYDIVKSGKWTWDKLSEMAKQVSG